MRWRFWVVIEDQLQWRIWELRDALWKAQVAFMKDRIGSFCVIRRTPRRHTPCEAGNRLSTRAYAAFIRKNLLVSTSFTAPLVQISMSKCWSNCNAAMYGPQPWLYSSRGPQKYEKNGIACTASKWRFRLRISYSCSESSRARDRQWQCKHFSQLKKCR